MERKEWIELLKQLYDIRKKECGNIPPYETSKEATALSSAIAEAELMERVSGGVEKRDIISTIKFEQKQDGEALSTYQYFINGNKVSQDEWNYRYTEEGERIKNNIIFNEAINLCNAHWIGKMGGIESFLKQWEIDNCHDMLPEQLAQALTNYLTEGL